MNAGEPDCFSFNSTFDVDSLTGGGSLEVCSEENHWCPENFEYFPENDECRYNPRPCYDESDPNLCNEVELDGSGVQRFDWLLAKDSCSFYDDPLDTNVQCCCLTNVVHGNAYQESEEVLVYPGNGQDPKVMTDDGSFEDLE